VVGAEIVEVRDREPNGIACGVEVEVMIGERSATVMMSWHYAYAGAAPRLATAFPSP
jgi:acetyltransferase-like isoleucine patch superfamily enzyme